MASIVVVFESIQNTCSRVLSSLRAGSEGEMRNVSHFTLRVCSQAMFYHI